MRILRTLSEYRWPIYLGGLLAMSVVACAVLVWVATRPDSPRPIKGYYDAARAWDADEAVEDASRQLGWTVKYELPSGIPHYAGMPRPVDVRVADRDGKPVSGLAGRLFAIRASDTRLNQQGDLTELPQEAGTYRTLVLLDQPGTWEFRIDARYSPPGRNTDPRRAGFERAAAREPLRFVHAARVAVAADEGLREERER